MHSMREAAPGLQSIGFREVGSSQTQKRTHLCVAAERLGPGFAEKR